MHGYINLKLILLFLLPQLKESTEVFQIMIYLITAQSLDMGSGTSQFLPNLQNVTRCCKK